MMYIEMTTFAVPTFLLSAIKFLLILGAVWLVIAMIGITLYNRSVARAIQKQAQIDAEIDRLHK